MKRRTSLASVGDPFSEINIQKRLNFLRESSSGGTVYVPKSWIEKDPALQRAVQELDWLRVEEPL